MKAAGYLFKPGNYFTIALLRINKKKKVRH